ncbi:hypothetical protein [Desulfurococcus amylolyticus]|uniref:hypothetical protein n=1 Tax=Desulfurococcus amylolyticus TaxID=94694 RepID=UPI0005B22086|nr:hypothetical protein [Desulfurococcus amylolyticus]
MLRRSIIRIVWVVGWIVRWFDPRLFFLLKALSMAPVLEGVEKHLLYHFNIALDCTPPPF